MSVMDLIELQKRIDEINKNAGIISSGLAGYHTLKKLREAADDILEDINEIEKQVKK